MRYGINVRLKRGIRLYLNLTHRCNLDCSHCNWKLFNKGMPKVTEEKTVYEWIDFLYDFPIRFREVFIVGGEPSLYKDIGTLVGWLLSQKKNVMIYSNMMNDRLLTLPKHSNLIVVGTNHLFAKDIYINIDKFYRNFNNLKCRKQYKEIGYTVRNHELKDIDRHFDGIAIGPDLLMFANYRQYIEHYNRNI